MHRKKLQLCSDQFDQNTAGAFSQSVLMEMFYAQLHTFVCYDVSSEFMDRPAGRRVVGV